jgi:fructuronate reductase
VSTLPTGLDRAALARVPADARPLVEPGALRPRVLHLGLGAFHRAHQAVYTERAAAATGEPWGIAVVAPRSADTAAALRAQDCLWSVTERGAAGGRTYVVGSVVDALALVPDAARVDALLADPDVAVVTLTITEKGHHRRPDGSLDTADPAIAADLAAGPDEARTVVGRLAAGLAARMRAGAAPLSVVSCDNMSANGTALAAVVRGFVEASSWPDRDRVLDRMAEAVTFPSTIVDRIVPATTDAAREAAAAALGVADALPVVGEPYRQWVLEDRFAGPRPAWERDGALLVPDVAPYQLTKLRLLNGAHSALAYLGLAAGATTIADAMATGWGETLVRTLAAEVAPTLPADGPDPVVYAADLVERFRNPGIRHLLRQIGSDGSLKVPERWLPVLRERLRGTGESPVLELALAGWVHATRPGPGGGQLFGTTDPAAEALAARWHGAGSPARLEATVRGLLDAIGAPDLAATDGLVRAVATRLPALAAGRVEL